MGGILPDADLGGEVVGMAVRIGPNTRMDRDVFMALYAPNADISPADGQRILSRRAPDGRYNGHVGSLLKKTLADLGSTASPALKKERSRKRRP